MTPLPHDYEPFTSPAPRRVPFAVPAEAAALHTARRVVWRPLARAGVPWWARLWARWQAWRLRRALARAAGTWRYRVRLVRGLRADVGLVRGAPLRALVDHRRRLVLFDYDRYAGRPPRRADPVIRDEARHIRERLGLNASRGRRRRAFRRAAAARA
ncbi:MAG: hypothetical protein D6776_09525 [Planctomycetota bacterium]|nr:MAG: hypothetical protein D6776_09525 [Planctomycetota bacterium]